MAITFGVSGYGGFTDDYPYTAAEVTLNTQASGSGFLVEFFYENGHAPTIPTCSDNKGNALPRISTTTGANSESRSYLFFCPSGTGGTGHVFRAEGSPTDVLYGRIAVLEIIGAGLTLDKYSANLDSATPIVTPSITPAFPNEAVIAFMGGRTTGAITVNAPFALKATQIEIDGGDSFYYSGAIATYIQSSAAAIAATFNQAGNTYSLNHIVSIRESGGGGPSNSGKMLQLF